MPEQKVHQFQYSEFWEARTGITFGIQKVLFNEQSDFQHVQVLETDAFGRLLTLDGLVMLTDRDEFVYHEMISHPALCLMDRPKRVLVVGGGDGGTVREVIRHPGIEHVDLVEIDRMVIDASRQYFPDISGELDNPRVSVHVKDGIEFVRNAKAGTYDLITVDSTDPVGFAEGLFGEDFYRDCARILTDQGILVAQTESPFDRSFRDTIKDAHGLLGRIFPQVHMYLAHIPTYPTGTWSFTMGSKKLHPLRDFNAQQVAERLAPFQDRLKYYNPDIHPAAFALPNFVRQLFE
jgi:spermidine synthase